MLIALNTGAGIRVADRGGRDKLDGRCTFYGNVDITTFSGKRFTVKRPVIHPHE